MQGLKRWTAAAAVIGTLAMGATAAQAASKEMTFRGEMVSLFDPTGLFGPTGFGDLADHSFTATFTYDLPSPGEVTLGGVHIVVGGAQTFKPAFVSGRLTFAGVTHVFANDLFGSVGIGGGSAGAVVRGGVDGGGIEDLTLNANFDVLPLADLGADFDGAVTPIDTGSGFRAWNAAAGDQALGVLFINHVTVSDAAAAPAAVPEPASWALMIAGFGLAGAALRRRGRVSLP